MQRKNKQSNQLQNQGVQGLQTFTLCVVNVNDEHTKPDFKRKLRD